MMISKQYFLATTALEETWGLDAYRVVFLGTQCKLYPKRDRYKTEKFINMPSCWDTQEKIEYAAEECKKIYEKKIEELTIAYNNIFNINEDVLYYERIFGYWLLDFINNIYDKYYCITYAYKKYNNLISSVMTSDNYYIPNDYTDYVTNSIDDLYSYQLYSQIIKILSLRYKIINPKNKINYKSKANKHKIKSIILRETSYFLNKIFQKQKILITNPYFNKSSLKVYLNLMFKSKFKIVFDGFNGKLIASSINKNLRENLKRELLKLTSSLFEKTLNELISINIPKAYLEQFIDYRATVANDTKRNADIYFTANAHYSNEYFKYKVAASKNSKYLIMQHGGGYGIFKINIGEYWETKIADRFYSFGWSNKKNIQYLAPSKFLVMPNIPKNKNNEILYVTNTISRYLRHFNGYGFFGDGSEELFINKRIEFLDNVDKSIKIKLRMYPLDHYKLYEKQRIIDKSYPNIVIDDYSKSFLDSLLSCKLHITDITMTTFLEALVYNIPTICFSPALKENVSNISKPYIDKLVKANILFFSAKEAAQHLNNISSNDIDNWWKSVKVQNAKNDFIYMFARRSESLETDWVKEFNRVLNERT